MQIATPTFLQHTRSLRLSDFTFDFPKELVAKYPAEPRDAARLMVVHRDSGTIEHRLVSDLPEYFGEGDVMVCNDTKVFPARLRGVKEKTNAKVEAFLVRELNTEHRLWDAVVDPARKVRVGNKIVFSDDLAAEVIDNTTSRGRTLRFIFEGSPQDLYDAIDRVGETPIPPYLRRPVEPEDAERYQSPFAKTRGAVSAPTAGLHFTDGLVDTMKANGTGFHSLTLHKGLGSFRPVEVEDLSKHQMRSEYYEVPEATEHGVNAALTSSDCTVTACGTTVARALETTLSVDRTLKADSGWTDKFIYPPYEFAVTERLLTNFQRPHSALMMCVAAFAGMDLTKHAYQEAVKQEYRLFSFGDAMLVL